MGVAPLSGAALGDPRVGAMVRIWHQPLKDAISLHAGFDFWIPIDAARNHAGDSNVRFMPKLVAAGLTHRILWSFLVAFQYRPDASIGALAAGSGNTVGSELKFGAAVSYADMRRRFAVGPELVASTVVTGPVAAQGATSSLEVLVGGHYNIVRQIEAGLALGVGLLTEPGTPDFRMILRIAYAPMRPEPPRPLPKDRDGDGITDDRDACPDDKGSRPPFCARTAARSWTEITTGSTTSTTAVPTSRWARTPIRTSSAARSRTPTATACSTRTICVPTSRPARTRTRPGSAARTPTRTATACSTPSTSAPTFRRACTPIRTSLAARCRIATRTA